MTQSRTYCQRDEASIHVVEAVLAGMVVLGAIIFLTSLSNPSPGEAESGIDLERVAADTLTILEDRPPEKDCTTYAVPLPAVCGSRLEEIVHQAMTDDAGVSDADDFMRQVIPIGNRYLLRLDNGIEPLTLLPQPAVGVAVTPRAAKAAETFLVPQWRAHVTINMPPDPMADDPCYDQPVYRPAGTGPTVDAGDSLAAPTGGTTAPGGDSWAQWWVDHRTDADKVPPDAAYGCWLHDGGYFRIALADGTETDHPAYAVQLVVWPIV